MAPRMNVRPTTNRRGHFYLVWRRIAIVHHRSRPNRAGCNVHRQEFGERMRRVAVLIETGQTKTGVELPGDLILQAMPEAQWLFLCRVTPPFVIRDTRQIGIRNRMTDD